MASGLLCSIKKQIWNALGITKALSVTNPVVDNGTDNGNSKLTLDYVTDTNRLYVYYNGQSQGYIQLGGVTLKALDYALSRDRRCVA